MATLTVYSSAGDGKVHNADPSWANARGDSGGDDNDDTSTTNNVGADSVGEYNIHRGFLAFDTSALPDNAEISGATLSLYVASVQNGDNDGLDYISLVAGTQASTSVLENTDFSKIGATKLANDIDIGSLSTGQYNIWTLNSTGLGTISKTGYTKFGLREGHDLGNSAIAAGDLNNEMVFRTSDYTGTASDPKLIITYTLPAGGAFLFNFI